MRVKELIDIKSNHKMVAMLMMGIGYDKDEYLVYSIKRSELEANVFISKLMKSSSGYVIMNDFTNGEKEVLDKIVQRILSRENVESLEKDGYRFIKNIELEGTNYFDIDLCYVTTIPKSLVKECLIHYNLVSENMLKGPIVEVREEKKKFNGGLVGNLFLVIFGIFIFIFSIIILYGIIFK